MSSNYRPQGSEKIQDPDKKLDRIREIAGISQKPSITENILNTKFSTVLHEAVAADGNTYGLVQDGKKVYLKILVNEHYEFITGDEKDYSYKDFATAFKQMNFVFKNISEKAHYENQINILEGGLTQKKNLTERFILKTPQAQAPVNQPVAPAQPAEMAPQADGGQPMPSAPDPQATQQLDQEIGGVEGQVEDQDPVKAMQKLTGKLTEKMRTADENIMTSEFIKSILNSVISAVDISKLEDADLLSIMKKLKGEDNPEAAGEQGDTSVDNAPYVDDNGIDYNVNNPTNSETKSLEEDLDAAGNVDMQPTWDNQVMPDILNRVIENIGMEINTSNEDEVRQAVTLFINTYGGDQNQTDFMKQLQDYVSNSGARDVNTANLRYSSLSPMGQQVFDQLELLDPSMGDLNTSGENTNSDFETNTDSNFQNATSNTNKLSFTGMNETQSYLKNKIMETLKKK